MTDNNHPITPPPWVVQAFLRSNPSTPAEMTYEQFIATCFARWGADQELEACCEWLLNSAVDGAKTLEPYIAADPETFINAFRAARRPKPPSLAEEALGLLNEGPVSDLLDHEVAVICRALERLQELEGQDDG